jgi:hypothetical protein
MITAVAVVVGVLVLAAVVALCIDEIGRRRGYRAPGRVRARAVGLSLYAGLLVMFLVVDSDARPPGVAP